MFSLTKWWVCILLGVILVTSVMHHVLQKVSILTKNKEQEHSSASITPLSNNRTFIMGAYYDNREKNLVRLISIVHRQDVKELYCWINCSTIKGYMTVNKAVIDFIAHDFGYPYVIAHLLCPDVINCTPEYVSIHWSNKSDIAKLPVFKIRNRAPNTMSADFTVCISTMFGNSTNVLQLVQAIEMYKVLGAQKVMIYKHSCSLLVDRVLQYYISEGTVEVIPWPIDLYLDVSSNWHFRMEPYPRDLGYYGQLATLNDCVYRNMYSSKYVVINDLDEIIVPKKHTNWADMMDDLKKQYPSTGIFFFQNRVFPNNVVDSTLNVSAWRAIPGFNLLQHVYREPATPYHEKMIVNPRKVIQISVHTVLKGYGHRLVVPSEFAFTHHCRQAMKPELPKESLIRDTILWKYSPSLIRGIEQFKNNSSIFGTFLPQTP
ncbi:glycosyltransferase family 92 protein F49C12.5-like [Pleurodeles waltl]|uniref:glycosyltransferase family 92 protein F49C12.5-like n=1 Tax=Pleurodeles waltl TaxID=8319 RepID=UPI0037093DE5